ncbi:uncharacterized protein LOC106867522 [Octopus bimaculoides]|nr:uncharacterized protein LOC106867522 [Octopus bimaculoides]|eukprot:XP_014767903.1 PREDICTED: uncharacterized protein LOC106867522 [Octopus bimaculoides]
MTVKILSVLLMGSVIIASVWAHPMKKTEAKAKSTETVKSKVPAKLHEQEKELEDLAKLQKEKVNHAVLQSSSDIKIVENNGKSEKTLKTTDNVIDGNNGKVVSSVKKVRKIGVAKGNKPKVEAKTEVDIPAEGIHNTFQDNLFEDDRQEEKKAAFKKSLPENAAFEESLVNSPENDIKDLIKSSESIAKYLLETGRFDKLDQSLRDVVRIGLMSKTEASEYKKMVLEYYEKLVELREAEELQSKLNAPPLDYAEQDYVMPFNGAGDTLDNRVYPYGQVDSASEDGSRYEDSNEEDSYPIDPSVNSQSEYVDIPADAIQQSYSRFPDMKQELVPVSREEEPQEKSDWLTGLLEQANYGGD